MSALKSFDRVAHLYDGTRGVPAEVAQAIGAGIASLLPRGDAPPRLLEIGIGTGRVAVPVAGEGVRVAGADISRGMLNVAREKRGGLDLVLAEAAHQPFASASFDAVLFVHVLHLVPDVEATLAAALRVVRPGGLVLLCQTERGESAMLETHARVRRR
ncbi:MAG: class I SAM-dependent methyltransferase, partial [Hyphomicrobiales bacterium]